MELKDLITEMQAKGQITIEQVRPSDLLTEDKDWWAVRAYVIAIDKDRMFAEYPLRSAIEKRGN